VLQELPLLPFDVLIEDLKNMLEIQRKHEDAEGIVFNCKTVSQQKLVIVELAIGKSRPLSSLDVSDSLDPHKGCLSMGEINEVKFAIGSKGMMQFINKRDSKLE